MKDENGIEICCENCRHCEYCDDKLFPDTGTTANSCGFLPSVAVYEARIMELQNSLDETEKKLTETVKLLSERSRECGKLEAEVKILKAFVLKVHTSPVIFEGVNRALRDEAKTLWERLNQSAESEEK